MCLEDTGELVRLISDILEYTDDHSLPGFLVTADIVKAFDSIEHPFIVATEEIRIWFHFY